MKTAVLFPGQGSQQVGMGQDVCRLYPAARNIFSIADESLEYALSELCFNGPQEDLNRTANTQPALLATSAAIAAAIRTVVPLDIACVAGHSLGEYTALWFTGSLDLPTALRLVRLRGESMQSATPQGVGAMAAIMGLPNDVIEQICLEAAQQDVLAPANYNAPGQTVVSGHHAAVERAVELARAQGAKRSVLLPVSAPFHCALMKPAADIMAAALNRADIEKPGLPVICNVSGLPIDPAPDAIRDALVRQITAPVQWTRSVTTMVETGIELFLEIGSGTVLSNLVKRIAPEIQRFTLSDTSDIKNFIDFYTAQTYT